MGLCLDLPASSTTLCRDLHPHPAPIHGHLGETTTRSEKAVARVKFTFALCVLAGPNPLSLLTFPKRCHGHTTNFTPHSLIHQDLSLNKMEVCSTLGISYHFTNVN